jgi:hypothetical protein
MQNAANRTSKVQLLQRRQLAKRLRQQPCHFGTDAVACKATQMQSPKLCTSQTIPKFLESVLKRSRTCSIINESMGSPARHLRYRARNHAPTRPPQKETNRTQAIQLLQCDRITNRPQQNPGFVSDDSVSCKATEIQSPTTCIDQTNSRKKSISQKPFNLHLQHLALETSSPCRAAPQTILLLPN